MFPVRSGLAAVPRQGESRSGDRALVLPRDGGLLAVVLDVLGHGHAADEVAALAEKTLREAAPSLAPVALFELVHATLRGTRGAAMTAVWVQGEHVQAAGVGNVALRSVGLALPFVAMPGVVGGRFRPPRVHAARRGGPARIVLHSDGVSVRFDPAALAHLAPDEAARALLERFGKPIDDATALIVDL